LEECNFSREEGEVNEAAEVEHEEEI